MPQAVEAAKVKVAEQMEHTAARAIGLVDYEELYRARRLAKLTSVGDSSEDSGEAAEGSPKKKKKNNRKRGKKKKKEEKKE